MDNKEKVILHLCADIGSDTLPYQEAGYDVRMIGSDIGVENYHPPENVYGIIANPPCTMFSIARTKAKTPRDLREGMKLVKECLRIIWECQYKCDFYKPTSLLKFWCIENPETGYLKRFLGKPTFKYQPYEYGANYSKGTALWGWFNLPVKPLLYNPIPKGRSLVGDVTTIMNISDPYERMNSRSVCLYSFAQSFFEANQ